MQYNPTQITSLILVVNLYRLNELFLQATELHINMNIFYVGLLLCGFLSQEYLPRAGLSYVFLFISLIHYKTKQLSYLPKLLQAHHAYCVLLTVQGPNCYRNFYFFSCEKNNLETDVDLRIIFCLLLNIVS